MQQRKYNFLLYFISLVILITLAIQFYWNYKNYQVGKQQLISEVQTSLDNAIDSYYIELAERNTQNFDFQKGDISIDRGAADSLHQKTNDFKRKKFSLDSLDLTNFSKIKVFSHQRQNLNDSLSNKELKLGFAKNPIRGNIFQVKEVEDSIVNLFQATSRIIMAITTDTLNIQNLNAYVNEQLSAKNLKLDYGYVFKNSLSKTQYYNMGIIEEKKLRTVAKSAYLPRKSSFDFYFSNKTATILKKILPGIILSALLIASVIVCLFFLLNIVKKQKQLAELKNDLISNVTHEFKTPISTVKVALEGMDRFNHQNDLLKNKKYLEISRFQLDKLQTMVEKLLETASLDGECLQLEKSEINVVRLLNGLVEKHMNLSPNKNFHFKAVNENTVIFVDPFLLDNALNNVLDNAIKYGGENIEVEIFTKADKLRIKISDDGNSLTKDQAEQIFEKFYRVSSGNIHDIKGFGIGLYYTRQIIEKHGGEIKVNTDVSTVFEIILPNG